MRKKTIMMGLGQRVRDCMMPAMVLLCAGAGLAACGQTAAPAGSGALAVSNSTAASPTPAPGSGAPSASQPAGEPGCLKAGLDVSAGGQDAASGHRRVVLVFTNTGTKPCSMRGYPGVAALNSAGTQVAQAARSLNGYMGGLASGQPQALSLSPGESASAVVEALASNGDGSACTAYHGLLVTAPDDTASTTLPWGNDGCSTLQVHPVVLGTTGNAG